MTGNASEGGGDVISRLEALERDFRAFTAMMTPQGRAALDALRAGKTVLFDKEIEDRFGSALDEAKRIE